MSSWSGLIYLLKTIKMDITKCTGEGCPLKESCYRFTSDISMMQSYFFTPPFENDTCDMYWGEQSESIYNQLKNITDESK
jgi:hypothetical protein